MSKEFEDSANDFRDYIGSYNDENIISRGNPSTIPPEVSHISNEGNPSTPPPNFSQIIDLGNPSTIPPDLNSNDK
jgi:hypothetical protein